MLKKLTMIALLAASSTGVFAQGSSFRAGLEGAFNSTWLFNKKVSDAGDNLDYKSTFGGQFGVSGLYNFKEKIGVSFGILSGSVNQKYTNRQLGDTYETEDKLKYIDIPVLFRFTSPKGAYFEIGPQFSMLSSSKRVSPSGTFDQKDYTNSMNIAAQLGFGLDVKATDKLVVVAGFRFGYGLTDAGKNKDNLSGYESTASAVGGLHLGLHYIIK